MDGKKWIFTHRQKTANPSRIPLLPPALEIIAKYSVHPIALNYSKVLPIPSNQKVNAYLKEIADCCGIKKTLTFHMARHTFATTVTLNNGVPLETVSKMMGHTKIQTTQIYAKILDEKVSQDMNQLWDKFENKFSIPISKIGGTIIKKQESLSLLFLSGNFPFRYFRQLFHLCLCCIFLFLFIGFLLP